jgi:ribosomal protein L35AE/L33A
MEATIMHFRQGRHHVNSKQMILKVAETAQEAEKTIGKKATWTSSTGKVISGTISALHGRKGNVRAIFSDSGLPGQSLGTKIQIE